MRRSALLTGATLPMGLGSVFAMVGQAAVALVLVRFYSPKEVGEFSVLSQLAFAWATLALAQGSISLLVDRSGPRRALVLAAMVASARRWVMLAPVALVGWLWLLASESLPTERGLMMSLLLATAMMSLLQAGWQLSQSVQLRWGSPQAIVLVRMVPPVAAAVLLAASALLNHTTSLTLVLMSCLGFAAGCTGLVLGIQQPHGPAALPPDTLTVNSLADGRSGRLKMAHTFTDLLVSTVLALHWAALYGAAAAAFLLLSLRVLGFIPALVSAGWSQGVLSRPTARRPAGGWVIALASAALIALAFLADLGASSGWLSPEWVGLKPYILPVAVWQWGAILVATVAYRPFLAQGAAASTFSRLCIGSNLIQLPALVLPPLLGVDSSVHLWLFVALVTILQGATAIWAASLTLEP